MHKKYLEILFGEGVKSYLLLTSGRQTNDTSFSSELQPLKIWRVQERSAARFSDAA
jgi:hypothetical protein